MMTINKVSMDLMSPGNPVVIDGVQEDRYSRSVELTLTADGEPWSVPGDASVLIRYSRMDGTGGQYDLLPTGEPAWSAQSNVLRVSLAPQVLAVSGPVNLWISLIRENVQLSTFALLLNVHSKAGTYEEDPKGYVNVSGFLPGVLGALEEQFLRVKKVSGNGYVQALEPVKLADLALVLGAQKLTDEQKQQVRENIAAATVADVLAALPTWEGGAY